MAATMRTEHVATTPRGYRVRSVKRGSHVVRVAFPSGARRKGTGKVVEILHPKSETNPSCIVSNQVRSNPGELIIFGNPSTQAAKRETRERAARIRGARLNPKRAELRKRIKALEAKFYPAMDRLAAARRAGGVMSPEYIAIEKETDKLSHDLDLARRLHSAAINPGKMTVDFDNARKQFRATMRHPDGGSNLYAWGYTKKQAAHALRDQWRAARRGNPTYVYFTFNGRQYRTDGQTVEGKDGQTWNRTGSLPVVLAARKEWAARKTNPWHPAGNFHSLAEAQTRKRHLEAAGHTVMMVVSARGTKAENYSVLTRKPVANPRRATKRRRRTDRRNPDETRAAVRLFEKFHGRDPKDITEKHVSAAMRKDYTSLGDLEHLKVITPLGQTVQFYFEGDGVKLASSPDGKQLYCIGGNQNLTACLDKDSLEKDFVDLGECIQVQYLARKVHANFEPVSYYHKFGEKTGARPQLAYNKLQKQIYFVGGEYFIDTKHGVSPGIEN